MTAYYNEHDPKAAAWLRELIKQGHIADGEVDERSIEDVTPIELAGYTQCHFFAGIGVWSYALRRAGWLDDRPVWTGSCPCQPFSAAGKGGGTTDERHLWPAFHYLIEECRPDVIFGEQVEAAIRHGWLDLVQADLEGIGYAFGAVGIPAAGVGAPHIRQRLYFVADSMRAGRPEGRARARHGSTAWSGCSNELADLHGNGREQGHEGRTALGYGQTAKPDSGAVGLADPTSKGSQGREQRGADAQFSALERGGEVERVADAGSQRRQQVTGSASGDEAEDGGARRDEQQSHGDNLVAGDGQDCRPGPANGHWRDADWLLCRDDKWRPVEPGTSPLAHGAPARVGRLRGYGNAICAPVAEAFIAAYLGV